MYSLNFDIKLKYVMQRLSIHILYILEFKRIHRFIRLTLVRAHSQIRKGSPKVSIYVLIIAVGHTVLFGQSALTVKLVCPGSSDPFYIPCVQDQ